MLELTETQEDNTILLELTPEELDVISYAFTVADVLVYNPDNELGQEIVEEFKEKFDRDTSIEVGFALAELANEHCR